jgi:hypothetical protein
MSITEANCLIVFAVVFAYIIGTQERWIIQKFKKRRRKKSGSHGSISDSHNGCGAHRRSAAKTVCRRVVGSFAIALAKF